MLSRERRILLSFLPRLLKTIMKEHHIDSRLSTTLEAGRAFAKHPPVRTTGAQVARRAFCALLALAAAVHLAFPLIKDPYFNDSNTDNHVDWMPCGDRFFCTTINAPLNHHNLSDPRSVSIAVVKMVANPPPGKERLGSIYINPGGPGGSGSRFAYDVGPAFQQISGGLYVSHLACTMYALSRRAADRVRSVVQDIIGWE